MLEVHQLTCIRDDRVLLNQLSFEVPSGTLIQIEGQNGAGKTTLLRILAGLGIADEGDVLWQGESIRADRDAYHRDLLYIGHLAGVKRELTPFENLAFYQRIRGDFEEGRLMFALEKAGLSGYEDVSASQLSAGQNRRIALAKLWLCDAKLWILDEPLTAIDKQGVRVLTDTFEAHVNQGGSVIFTTHQDMPFEHHSLRRIKLGI